MSSTQRAPEQHADASAFSLLDRYTARSGTILLTGVQALVRLMLVQADRDRSAGIRSGGFVSGYRGSPLGTLDTAFAAVKHLAQERNLVVQPAVNEEMAATAIAGTQQIARSPGAKVEGVYSLWYGKGPGLDRASDAIRHGNLQGSSPKGGVVLAVGDDHVAKSSSIVCNTSETCTALQLPLFAPADAAEVIAYGLHGFTLSRHTGSWVALKILPEIADATHSIVANEMTLAPLLPAIDVPAQGLHYRWPETPLDQELRQQRHRLPAVLSYVRANALDRTLLKRTAARIGLLASGKSWLDLLEALRLLGLDEARLAALGVALYKPALIWPLEPAGLMSFAEGLATLIVVEEKGPLIESQVKNRLYGIAAAPDVFGKTGPGGSMLFPETGDLSPERVAAGIGQLIHALTADAQLHRSLLDVGALLHEQSTFAQAPVVRKPFFCSGCPHNRSTVTPEGSRALAGIGCHGLAAYNRPNTETFAQMGGEGVHWMGLAPFTAEAHVFANIGDGTYFHSGILAIRQAVAAKLNITYRLLYNGAVAMTGGQALDGELSVAQLIDQLRAEGVSAIVVATDDLSGHPPGGDVRTRARVVHREELEALQREMRETPGVSVLIYEQMCATEKRRLRKRGKLPDPAQRVFINEQVCEGCGDCSVKSNCLSVEPIATELGVKRRINQSSCNKDYSCLDGFCPSFVTVEGGRPRRVNAAARAAGIPCPEAHEAVPKLHERIVVAGIGGTGVVTIGALVATAAHIAGRKASVLDQVGMAQKGGAVLSHIHVARDPITALRIPAGQADLVLVCDQIVGNARDVITAIDRSRTRVIVNADMSITGDFTQHRDAIADAGLLTGRLQAQTGQGNFAAHPFTRLAERLFGDSIGSNLMMVGLAYQKGWIGIDLAAFDAAIALNGVAAAMNRAAFAWGRRLASAAGEVYAAAGLAEEAAESLDETIAHRTEFLRSYQNQAYSERYRATIERLRAAERAACDTTDLTSAAARSLFKLMAYKDEYEVARLFTDGRFRAKLAEQFEGDFKVSFHLAPPLLARRDRANGQPRKRKFGPWMAGVFTLLAPLRALRGTPFDVFGYTGERRNERRMAAEFEQVLAGLAVRLQPSNLAHAVEIASLPLQVRGFGHVKARAVEDYRHKLRTLLARFDAT